MWGQTVAQLYGCPASAVNACRASIGARRRPPPRTWPGWPGAPCERPAESRPGHRGRTAPPGAGAPSPLALPHLVRLAAWLRWRLVPGLELVGPLHQARECVQERRQNDLAARGARDLRHVLQERRHGRREIEGQTLPVRNSGDLGGWCHRIAPHGVEWRGYCSTWNPQAPRLFIYPRVTRGGGTRPVRRASWHTPGRTTPGLRSLGGKPLPRARRPQERRSRPTGTPPRTPPQEAPPAHLDRLAAVILVERGESLPPCLEGVDNSASCPPHGSPPIFIERAPGSTPEGMRRREGGSERESLALARCRAWPSRSARRRSVGRYTGPRTRQERPGEPRSWDLAHPSPVAAFASQWRFGGCPLLRLGRTALSREPGACLVDVQGRLAGEWHSA